MPRKQGYGDGVKAQPDESRALTSGQAGMTPREPELA